MIKQLEAGRALLPLLTVIPGEDERNEETDAQEHGRAANDTGRPAEVLSNKAEHLKEEPCPGYIRDRPLGDPALRQALENGCHGIQPVGEQEAYLTIVESSCGCRC